MMIGPSLLSMTANPRDHHVTTAGGAFEIIGHKSIAATGAAPKTKRKLNGLGTKGAGKKSRFHLHSGRAVDDEKAFVYKGKDALLGDPDPDDLQLEVMGNYFCGVGDGQTLHPDGDAKEAENSNLSWLLNFKVASLFDPTEDGNSSRRSSSEDDSKEGREEIMTVSSPDRPNKPPYTYTELIEQALKEKGELTVSGIYYWISERFPFYKVHDDRWKNSVRHNLSINPHFRKGMKASQGAGHLWTLSTQGVTQSPDVWKKNRVKNLINLMDEVAVATASIEEPSDGTTTDDLSPQPSLPLTESSPDPSLARSAEEILSGVKKQVEVQYLSSDTEFLNTITKDEIVDEESSLVTEVISAPYLINELGSEVILSDGLFCDDLSFQCCELTSTTNL